MASVGTGVSNVRERLVAVCRSLYEERSQFWWQVVTALVALLYVASLAFMHRTHHYSSFWDGWVGNIACTLPMFPLLLRGLQPVSYTHLAST